jgi:hypothetical protein
MENTSGVDQERSTREARAKAAQAACPHAEWEDIGLSRHIRDDDEDRIVERTLLQCPACGLMRWADDEVPS